MFMSTLDLPEFLILAAAVVLVVFGRKLPEFLQSIVLSKKQFNKRKSEVERPLVLIDYTAELKNLNRL